MTRKEILEKTIDFDDAIHRIVRLEEENAKLKSECRRCVYTDCPYVLSDFRKDRNGICDHFKDVFDKNAELEEKVSYLEDNFAESREKRIAELEAQIEKMKELLEKWYNQYSDKTYTETFYQDLLRATEKYLWTDVEA